MTKKAVTWEIPELIQFLVQELHDLPDDRKPGNNTKYQVEDAVKAAFSVFFTQSPSFLEHQRLMKSSKGKDDASSFLVSKKYLVIIKSEPVRSYPSCHNIWLFSTSLSMVKKTGSY